MEMCEYVHPDVRLRFSDEETKEVPKNKAADPPSCPQVESTVMGLHWVSTTGPQGTNSRLSFLPPTLDRKPQLTKVDSNDLL